MKQEYETIREFAKDYRLEIVPMMKSKGFGVSISTSKGSYYYDGRLNFQIKKIPSNFYVWTNEYNRYSKTVKSEKLLSTIRERVTKLIAENTGLDVDLSFGYHKDVRWKDIPDGWDDDARNYW